MKIGFDLRALLGRAWFVSGTGSSEAPAGVAGFVYNVLKHITDVDSENEYILFFNSFKKPQTQILQKILEKPNVTLKTFSVPNKIFDRSARFFEWPKIDRLLGGVDLFYSPHIGITPLTSGTRHVLTVHDLSFEIYPEFFPLRKRFWHWSQNIQTTCQNADAIIAVSENTRQDIIHIYGVDPKKITVSHPGFVGITKDTDSVEKNMPLNKPYLLYVGTLEPRKNVVSIIEAFNLLKQQYDFNPLIKELQLVIAGGKGWLYRDIERAVRVSPFQSAIQLRGYVSEAEKWHLLKHAQLFVFPSYYEGFGFPVLEAMSVETPVVTSHHSSLSEISGGAAFLIDPYNVQSIASGIYSVFTDNSLREKMITNGLKQIQKYNWQKTAEHILQVFKSVS